MYEGGGGSYKPPERHESGQGGRGDPFYCESLARRLLKLKGERREGLLSQLILSYSGGSGWCERDEEVT